MDALVVSKETLAGCEGIMQGRLQQGLKPLTLVVVGLVGEDLQGGKLSSTKLRQQQAEAQS